MDCVKPLRQENRTLFQNTALLYLLQFSSYFLSFFTIPYQTRVLGPTIYGVLGVATALMTYFQLVMDFGFLLSATEDISTHREDRQYLAKKLTVVTVIKLGLALISIGLVLLLTFLVSPMRENRLLYLLYILAFAAGGLLPDYFFRGIEAMWAITLRTVAVKTATCLATFALLRRATDAWVIPLLLLIGNLVAVCLAYLQIIWRMGYRPKVVTVREVWRELKRSAPFFISRMASTVYSAANTLLLGLFWPAGAMTGFYTSADRIFAAAKGAVAPVSDSLYPYMVRHRNFGMVRRVLLWLEPPILLVSGLIFWQAEPICIWIFGAEYGGVAPILRGFLPGIALLLPSYVLGFPTLGAMGKTRLANASIFFGVAVHTAGLALLVLASRLAAIPLAWLTSVSETSIFAFRLIAVLRHKLKKKECVS